jgi:hypothetical protein
LPGAAGGLDRYEIARKVIMAAKRPDFLA